MESGSSFFFCLVRVEPGLLLAQYFLCNTSNSEGEEAGLIEPNTESYNNKKHEIIKENITPVMQSLFNIFGQWTKIYFIVLAMVVFVVSA